MNKKVIIIIIIALILLIGISTKLYLGKIKTFESKYQTLNKLPDFYMEVQENTVTSTSLTFNIYNDSNEQKGYGVNYEIEVYKNGKWMSFAIAISWIDIWIIVPPNSYKEEKIEWIETYGKLPKGKYRLIKEIDQKTILFDEFEIN